MTDQDTDLAPSLTHSQFLRVALSVLSLRAAKWFALVAGTALFAASAWWPDWRRLSAAAAFAVLLCLPIWFRKEAR